MAICTLLYEAMNKSDVHGLRVVSEDSSLTQQ